MNVFDALFGGFAFYRRLRGGRWELTQAYCACPVEIWERHDVPRWGWPYVIKREDYRR